MKIKALYKILVVFCVITLFSCQNSYQKLLKSSDYDLKLQKAKDYYNGGDYVKAIPLFEELIGILKGTRDVEDLYYFYPYCYYGQSDYQFAAYYFKNFIDYYPRSAKAEDARFMIAYCYYKLSPVADLDQEYTLKAIEAFQLFANNYPESDQLEECNQLMDELRAKMEEKAFNSAKLYYDMRDYLSAATAFNNVLLNYPETSNQETISYLIMRSHYLYAENSIKSKQEERYTKCTESYLDFLNKFPESKYIREAEDLYQKSIEALDVLKSGKKEPKKLLDLKPEKK